VNNAAPARFVGGPSRGPSPGGPHAATPTEEDVIGLLKWALIFLVVAGVAALFGFGGIAEGATDIAKTALSRRGVAHLCIPKDVQKMTSSNDSRSAWNVKGHSANINADAAPIPDREQLQAAADIINAGKKVAILVGRGALGCAVEVEQLAELVGGPLVKALLGKAVIADDSPYTTGGLGLLGPAPLQDAMRECDTLVMIGTSFPYVQFIKTVMKNKIREVIRSPPRFTHVSV
jgi:thiamine pyrophosphate-dependent acetolactate synthase large subunit-like protein